ncbi:AcrR family transcriptional regulator [Caulobacter ginsengisoli]|uniref:AcrR family transcriptional regulator n=1 Tax=Caulobacter ginsengisoli TaxID=400775 RepID=A0ABU0IS14_9CAUL|nr:helix-turn-helix domain-containing protein [Caulobacter ginsengisoli]MDQ0464205.1 AcrR family transcriptional regulator [Caulobacter ginsengisoli]
MARQADRSAATIRRILDTARDLFAAQGYEAVSVDMISAAAGLTKGACYHHFASKKDLFERLIDEAQAVIAARLDAMAAGRAAGPPSPRSIAAGAVAYLRLANGLDVRRLLLVDGPSVMGWQRWREIDDRHFAGRVRRGVTYLLGPAANADEIEAATRVIMGAIMEAALASGATADPEPAIVRYGQTIESLLAGLAGSGSG